MTAGQAVLDRNRAHITRMAVGLQNVITHVSPPDRPCLKIDAVFGVKESLIGDLPPIEEPLLATEFGVPRPFWRLEWNFTLVRSD